MSKQLADILVETGIISRKTLERALERQKAEGCQLEEVLLDMGVVTLQELEEALLYQDSSTTAHQEKKLLGDLLVEARIISQHTVGRALERQKSEGKQLGVILSEMGVISEFELIDALGKQLGFKTLNNFSMRSFEPDLLSLLSAEFVLKHLVFPLQHKDFMLAVAINNPSERETINKIASITGLGVVPVIAPQSEIINAISRHYLNIRINPDANDTILVVDGSAIVASVIQTVLVKEGFNVIISTDGIDAVRLTITQRPRLVITDAQLPGLDGFGLLHAIKVNPLIATIPVIMLTGQASSEDEKAAFHAGFFDFLTKPVQPLRVAMRVKRALEITGRMK